jgi:uncharacterized protein YndB with AHSA1/START domain
MTVISAEPDYDKLTLTLVAEFEAPIERVWELWSDPRKLERWWGPPTYPAKFEKHELTSGGEASYFMTGPEGDVHGGMWRITAVDSPNSLEFTDAFTDRDGTPNSKMPVTQVSVRFTERDGLTRMEVSSAFQSREDLDKLVEMGMVEGLKQAVGQMDALLVA